jgi:transcriptional regulator of heat shock response
MATTEKTNRAVERLAESTRNSYQTVVDHAVGLQERNVRFAQGMVDGTIKELHQQAESNRNVVGELFERAEDQRDAYRALVEQSLDAYMDLAYAPFTYYTITRRT